MKPILLLPLLFTTHATACIWVEGTNLHGEHRRTQGAFPDQRLQQAIFTEPEDKIKQLLSSQNDWQPGSISEKEFQGVKELLTGNHDHAIAILEQLEAEQPGRYGTAANLGTAYELKGDLDSALKWIQEGIRRNPDSHHSTEWVHVEILKARIKLRENPRYLHDHRVIPMPDSYTEESSVSIGGHNYHPREISDSIEYQLQERMIFVKPPDPVVADLLFTFGQIESRINILQSGKRLLNMAHTYGFTNPALITREINLYDEAIAAAQTRKTIRTTLWITGILLVFTALIVLAWKTKHLFLTRAAYDKHRAATSPQL